MNRHLARAAALAVGIALAGVVAGPQPAAAGKAPSQATVTLVFVRTDGWCAPVITASWSGYRVNHVRFLAYLEGRSGDDVAWLDTKGFPHSESATSGSFTSAPPLVARPDEGWYAYALFRSNGGARLAEAWSPVVHAPADCRVP